MSYLEKAIDRSKVRGKRVVFYGAEGSGKTTLATSAPKSLLIQCEDGSIGLSDDLDVTILPVVHTFEDVQGILKEVAGLFKTGMPFETIIIDSATALERLMGDYTVRCDPKYATNNKLTLESCHDGFGRGHIYCNDVMTRFLATLDWFIGKGVNITMTCHAMAITEKDTIAGDEYTTMDCALFSPKNGKNLGRRELVKQWCDILGYLHTPIYVTGKDGGFKTAISAGSDKILGLHSNPKYAAKNRFSLQEPLVIPKVNGWQVLMDAIDGNAPAAPVAQVASVTHVTPADVVGAVGTTDFDDMI